MNSERFKKAEKIYHAALELDPDRRPHFLEEECGGDFELKREIESLLSFDNNPASFIDGSPDDLAAKLLAKKREIPGSLVNKKIGRYRVEKILGIGGMGTVYLATDTRLARPVALKVLASEIVRDRDRVQRFMHEARAASALNHPHILTVYEFDEFTDEEDETLHFISMEFVEGKTLDNLIYSDKTSTTELFKYLAQAAKGLAKAHAAGIIHRDLKPENIMVSNDGYAKILDFGLAKLTDTEHELHILQQHKSRSGVILGTLGYMSPEQAQGKRDIDERSDIFALGCVLYEAVAKRKAFEADSAIDSLHKIIHAEPAPLKEIYPNVPAELEELVAKCLEKDPTDRYRNASHIARLLEKISTETIDQSKPFISSNEAKTIIREKKVTLESPSRSFSGQRRQVTAMFIDASAISDMLEDFDPERSLQLMNDLWGALDNLISNRGGRISEHLAGTNLAVWGTDQIRESDPENAVRTALELQKSTNDFFNRQLSGEFKLSDVEKEELGRASFLKIAISTGTVLIGESTDTGEFLSAGSAVSSAKRLVSKASMGDVFVSHDTYRHIRGIFEVEEVALQSELPFKRKKHETKTYSIKGIKPRAFRMSTRGVEGIETLLVGREAELIKLLDALEAVKEDKELQVVTVVGEAGLGKSRLLFEFHDQLDLAADRFFVFKARALESKRGMPFSLVRDLFLFRFEIQENDPETIAREKFVNGISELARLSAGNFGKGETAEMKAHFIGHLIGIDFSESQHLKEIIGDEEQIQDRAFVYSSQFFAALSQKFPAVFYLDDLHWADDESLNFFDHVTRECSDEAILVTEFTRPALYERRPHWGEGETNRFRLNLHPLTKRESGKLIRNILQKAASIPKELVELLVSNTEGNPFYVEELIKMLIEQGAIKTTREEWIVDSARLGEIKVPPTLTGVLQSRLDKLSPREKRILQRASVVGREFWDTSLKSFEEEINVPTVLESLRSKELLFRKETSSFEDAREYVFKHALLRDVTYETVLLEERRQWHFETAVWLVETKGESRNGYLAVIAEHFARAEENEKAAFWYGKAGEQARRSHALEIAEKHLLMVMKFWQESGEMENALVSREQIMKWKHSLGRVYYAQARYSEAIEVFADLLEMAKSLGDKLSQAYAYWGLSFSQFESGETRNSLECAQEMVRLTQEHDLADAEKAVFLLAMGLYRQGRALIALGEFDQAISLTEKRLTPLAASSVSNKMVDANRLHLLAAANMFLGRFGEAQKFELEEVEISRAAGDLRTVGNGLNSLGFQSYMQGHGKKAIRYYEEALEIAREIGNKSTEIMVRSNICGAKVLMRDFEPAEKELKLLIEEVSEKGHFLVPEMYRFLTEALIGQGKFNEALETATKSLISSLEAENQETIGEAWRVLGIVSSCLNESITVGGELYAAANCFEKGLTVFENLKMEANYAQTLHNFAQHHTASGNQSEAHELLGREKEISKRLKIDTAAKSVYF